MKKAESRSGTILVVNVEEGIPNLVGRFWKRQIIGY